MSPVQVVRRLSVLLQPMIPRPIDWALVVHQTSPRRYYEHSVIQHRAEIDILFTRGADEIGVETQVSNHFHPKTHRCSRELAHSNRVGAAQSFVVPVKRLTFVME